MSYNNIIKELRDGFKSGAMKSIESRKSALNNVLKMLSENEEAISKALYADLRRCRCEALSGDVLCVKHEISSILSTMDSALVDESVSKSFMTMLDSLAIQRQPLGVVFIIGSWNFPFYITISPLIGALASGNTVLLKPSELSGASAALIKDLISKYLDKSICQVICGDAKVCTDILETEQFDHIFFTGSARVGREIYIAAAKKLTPVTLELGGKCPTYIDANCYLDMAVKRTFYAKFYNAGQVCVAPDYVLCHESLIERFTKEMVKLAYNTFGKDPQSNPDFARIINTQHCSRLIDLIDQTEGSIVFGGEKSLDEKFIGFTIVSDVDYDKDVLMKDEIFGPILPIISVKSDDVAIELINSKDKPLAIYVFTQNNNVFNNFKQNTSSGSLTQNDCSLQVIVPQLPFGGVGKSGFGSYHGIHSLKTFSHHRSIILKTTIESIYQRMRYGPYRDETVDWVRWAMNPKSSTCNIL